MKPILMNTEMVKAILANRKTVTRRVIKPQPKSKPFFIIASGYTKDIGKWGVMHTPQQVWTSPCHAGDILYVRETWNCLPIPEPLEGTTKTYWYKADECNPEDKWRPSIHMPKEAARIYLRVKNVQVARLQDMTQDDAEAEGFRYSQDPKTKFTSSPLLQFYELWNSTIKKTDLDKYSWEANPWVWVIEFERISKEEAKQNDNQ